MTQREPSRASLAVIFLTVFIDLLGFGMVLPLLPAYADEFGKGLGEKLPIVLGLLMSSFSAMQFLVSPWWGRLSDRVGRRPVLMIGLTGSVVCYTLFGVATVWRSLGLLFISRIGAGIAGATISTAQAYIADCTPKEGRTRGMALIGAAFGLGFTLGPLLGVAATKVGSDGGMSPWPGYFAAMLSAGALALAIFGLPESHHPGERSKRERFDRASLRAALATPSVGLLIGALLISGLAFANLEATLTLFLKHRAEAAEPELARAASANPASPEATAFHERVTSQVLWVFAYIGVVLTVAQGVLVRRLSLRVPDQTLLIVGSVISIVGYLMMGMVGPRGTMAALLAGATVEIVGFAMINPSLNSLISRRSDPAQQGGILGIAQSASALARIFGPVVGIQFFYYVGMASPLFLAAVIMCIQLALVIVAVRQGHDFGAATTTATTSD